MTKALTNDDVPTKSHIIFILDKSGSMWNLQKDSIGGFNSFIDKQKNVAGDARVSLITFSTNVETVFDSINLKDVPELTEKDYQPVGGTALYDAIGSTLSKYMALNNIDEKTIVAIVTDGEENSSKEYTQELAKTIITNAETTLNWEVLFMAANIDVKKYGSNLNVSTSKMTTFDASVKGLSDAYNTLNVASTIYRSVSKNQADLNVNIDDIHNNISKQ